MTPALTLSALLHAAVLGVLAYWAVAPETRVEGQGASLTFVYAPDLPTDPFEDLAEMDIPEVEEVPVVADVLPPMEAPLEVPDIEDVETETYLPALDAEPTEADVLLSDLSVRVVSARIRRKATPPATQPVRPAERRAPEIVEVALRPAVVVVRDAARQLRRSRTHAPRARLTPLHMPRIYPESARRMGLEGRALVLVTIGADGRVVNARLVLSTGHPVLDEAALTSARAWRFRPPGERRRLELPFRYHLQR